MLDVNEIIRQLVEERTRLDLAIASLEALLKSIGGTAEDAAVAKQIQRKGRRFMSQAERLEVSRRMRQYWEMRREARKLDKQIVRPADDPAEPS